MPDKTSALDYSLRDVQNWDWVVLVIVGIFAMIAMLSYVYHKRFKEFIQLPLTDKYFKLQGKVNVIQHPFNAVLFVTQVLSFSLYIFLLFLSFHPDMTFANPWLFIQIITFFAGFILLKYFLEKTIAHIFNLDTLVNGYLYEKLSYTSLISILVFAANILFYFAFKPSKQLLLGFSALIVLLFVISLLSSFKRNWNTILRHFFYFILYLCALEFAPLIILYQLLV